jgi:hypothetical protein
MLSSRGATIRRCARTAAAIACLWLLAACATQTIQQSTAFGKAGIDYTDAVGDFLDVYVVTRIDVNSRLALDARAEKVSAQLSSELVSTIADYDQRAIRTVRETVRLRDNVRLLRAYFENLNALATSNLPEEGGAALKSLGAAIQDVNTVTGGSGNVLTEEQLGYVEKLGRLGVKAAVSARLREALERDKQAVGWQLAWQETMLATLVKPVRDEYERALAQMHDEKIVRPYSDGSAQLGATWVDDRRKWIQSRFQVEAFARAQKAAAHMRTVWEDMLSGQSDPSSIRLMLADLKEFSGAVRAFDAAERKK